MLISHSHRFIFVHVPKNGGTSITNALLPFITNRWQRTANRFMKRFGILHFAVQPFESHIKTPQLIAKLGERTFKSYFSFAIVRNPWDRQVSLYTYALKTPTNQGHSLIQGLGSFDAYIRWRATHGQGSQYSSLFGANGQQLVDFIGRYEKLEEDFQNICARIGIATTLPRLNVSRSKPYQDYYTEETKELVRQAFQPDIRQFNYEFEQSA